MAAAIRKVDVARRIDGDSLRPGKTGVTRRSAIARESSPIAHKTVPRHRVDQSRGQLILARPKRTTPITKKGMDRVIAGHGNRIWQSCHTIHQADRVAEIGTINLELYRTRGGTRSGRHGGREHNRLSVNRRQR